MNETPRKIEFETIYKKIAENHVIRTKDGSLRVWLDNNNATDISMDNFNNSYIDISIDNFNNFYMKDFQTKIKKLKNQISESELLLDISFFETLRVLSSPILKDTCVPHMLEIIYITLNSALSNNNNRNYFESSFRNYLQKSETLPGFMELSLYRNIQKEYRPFISPDEIPTFSTIDEYGIKYTGQDILDFSEFALLATLDIRYAKLPIMMLKYPSLLTQDENAKDYKKPVSCKELLDFYSPKNNPGIIYELMKSGEIDKDFSNLHTKMLAGCSKGPKNTYYKSLIKEISEEETYLDDLLTYSNLKIIPDDLLLTKISSTYLITKFNNGELPFDRILDFYNINPKDFKELITITNLKKYQEANNPNFPQIELNVLKSLPYDTSRSYLSKEASLETIMYLFLHYPGKITIEQLKQLLNEKQITETLDSYIDKGSNVSKIKELYENYLIDYGCIKKLVNDGIITEKDLKNYNLGIPKDDIYSQIQVIQKLEIHGARDIVPFSTTGTFIGEQIENKETNTKLTDLYRILGNIESENSANLPIISHKIEQDKQGFLDGYRICPLKSASLVAFLPPESAHAKPTYILPYQEMAFILQNKALPIFLLNNPVFKEVTPNENMHETILRIVLQFEEARKYLKKLGYQEEETFDNNMQIMLDNFNRIKTKGA